ncbi:MAG: hypothetical protein HZB43_04385 [candidate division Zixibacteria bacterium]|nr:hypothetical protein [candidate division Zixibacteria bacterium]
MRHASCWDRDARKADTLSFRKGHALAWGTALFVALVVVLCSLDASSDQLDANLYPSVFRNDSLRQIVRRGIELTFNDQFTAAESLFARVANEYPVSPIGPLFAAAAVHAQMLDGESAIRSDEFFAWLNRTKVLAERWRDADPKSGEPEFVLGAALGYQAVYESRWGGWFAALKQGMRSKNRFADALKRDSTLTDALLGIGNFNYWKSAKTDFINWTGIIADDRTKGLAQLAKAATSGVLCRAPARVSLGWALINERRYAEAYACAETLAIEFPQGKGPLWIEALAKFGLYEWDQSRQLYADLERPLLAEGSGNYFNLIDCAYFCALCNFYSGRWRQTLDDCHKGLAYPAPPDIRDRQSSKLKKLRELQESVKQKIGSGNP